MAMVQRENMTAATRTKVVVIGPSSGRYNGGIAHFTSLLAEALESFAEVGFLSWIRQYPPFLLRRNVYSDPDSLAMGSTASHELLDYLNPASWLRTVLWVRRFKADKVFLTWVHPVHAPVYLVMIPLFGMLTKAERVLVCHNVEPHEKFPGSGWLSHRVFRLADMLVVHGAAEEKKVRRHLGNRGKVKKLFHPVYSFPETREAPRRESGDILRMLFFGAIRSYKGLDLLLNAVAQLVAEGMTLELTVAGEPFDQPETDRMIQLVDDLGLGEVVRMDLRYVPSGEVAGLFYQADVLVLPYRDASASGPLMVAYQFGVPVICTRRGTLEEMVVEGRSGLLCEPNAGSIADAIRRFARNPVPEDGVLKVAANYTWAQYAEKLVNNGIHTS